MVLGDLVSVIIPVYNVEQYLPECLDSIISQTYTKLEIIIIDDGSTDGSYTICDEYAKKDCRIRLVHQYNRGLSAARNIGLEMMKGKIVAFLDGDDAYHHNYIYAMISSMIEYGTDITISRFTTYQDMEKLSDSVHANKQPSIQSGIYNREYALRQLVHGGINHSVWNKVYKAYLWQGIRFPEGHVYEDIYTTFQIFDRCKFVFVLDESLYFYRRRPGSITSIPSIKTAKDWISSNIHLESYIMDNIPEIFSEDDLSTARKSHLGQLVSYYLQYYNTKEKQSLLFCEELRNSIRVLMREISDRNISIRKRILLWMICYFPHILKVVDILRK